MRDLDDLVEFCKKTDLGRDIIAQNPILRHKLAQRKVEVETARQFAYYIAWLQSKRERIPAQASAGKYFAAELMLRVAHTGLDVLGLYACLKHDSKWAQLRGRFEYIIQHGLGPSFAGGTNEIQKNIIAWMGLELPRL
jgi:alkylation response protein AidB-like acyl-CoA dehydrogenase